MAKTYACAATALSLLLFSGCAALRDTVPPQPVGTVEIVEDKVPVDWRSVVTTDDADRLERIDLAWQQGLAAARRRFATLVEKEGPLLDPVAGLPRAAPSPGPYLCRMIRLGGRPAFVAFKPFHCYVEAEGELLTMVKQTGTQRPAGRLWAERDARLIFLGATPLGTGIAPAYAADAARDYAGYVERVDTFRWRLAAPWPQNGSALEVFELVPIIPQA